MRYNMPETNTKRYIPQQFNLRKKHTIKHNFFKEYYIIQAMKCRLRYEIIKVVIYTNQIIIL